MAAETVLPTPAPGTGTGWFVYGVARPELEVPTALTGIDEQPVRLLPRGDVAAVASVALLDRPPGRRAEILAFTGVLDSLAVPGPVAPLRFGSIFADSDQVADELLSDDSLGELLDILAGRLQLRLIATYREEAVLAEVVASDPEIARLREVTRDAPADRRYADRVALGRLVASAMDDLRADDTAAILDVVAPHCVAMTERAGSGLERVFEAYLLVEAPRRHGLEETLEDLAERLHHRMRLQLIGPTAPYDFVGGASWV